MNDAKDPFGFGKFVPGFDFLQTLARQPGGSMPQMPGVPGWVAPTLDVEELGRRIEELRAVQFWLEQNTTAIKATLQALEVQKMTLAALRGMNVSMEDMAAAFRAPSGADPLDDVRKPVAPESATSAPSPQETAAPRAAKGRRAAPATPAATAADPVQWWGALTEQFQQIASGAMQDVARKAGATGSFAQAFAPAAATPAKAPRPASSRSRAASSDKKKATRAPATRKRGAAGT